MMKSIIKTMLTIILSWYFLFRPTYERDLRIASENGCIDGVIQSYLVAKDFSNPDKVAQEFCLTHYEGMFK